MKIVNRKEFLKLPENTVYSKFEPNIFEYIQIKGESIEDIDWFFQPITDSIEVEGSYPAIHLDKAIKTGKSINMDFNLQERDGCFDQDQLFAVWEKEDVIQLIARLSRCLL